MDIGIGVSKNKDISSALKEVVLTARQNLNNQTPDIGFLFSSADFASPSLLKGLHLYLPKIPIVGISTFAVLFNSSILRHSLALCLIHSENLKLSFAKVEEVKKNDPFMVGYKLATKLLEGLKSQNRSFAFLFLSGIIKDGSRILSGLQEKLGINFPIIGACASDNFKFKQMYLYFNDELLTDAVVGVLFGGKLSYNFSFACGFSPIGKFHKVTSSQANIIKEIDNQPAINLYKDYFGLDNSLLKNYLKYISTFYPLGIYLKEENKYLLRKIISIEEKGWLTCQTDVPQDSLIRLMISTRQSCLSATENAVKELIKEKINMDILFVFNSISHYSLLYRIADEELKTIQSTIKIPLIGVYTYGEQAPLRRYPAKTYFHNQSLVLTAIGD